MYYLIFILIGVVAYFYLKGKLSPSRDTRNQTELPIKITVSSSGGRYPAEEKVDSGDIVETESGYVLNPKSPLPLTVNGLTRTDAFALKGYLDAEANWGRKLWEITYLFAQSNATCKEVEEYIRKYRPAYTETIERLKTGSKEWSESSEKDKEDMLAEYKQKAIDGLPVKPSQPEVLDILFDNPPSDLTADDKILSFFNNDVELYRFYVSQLWRAGKVVSVPAEDHYRKQYEALVEKRLARRGQDIGMEEILDGLRLKDINEALQGLLEKPFGRKAKAIEFAVTVPDIKERLGKIIAFREMFQIREPEGIDVQEIQKCYEYANVIATLVRDTYVHGARTLGTISEVKDAGFDLWQIRSEDCCESCKQYHGKKYKRKPSKLPPFHLGCNCELEGSDEEL